MKINKEYAPDLFDGSRDVVVDEEPKVEKMSEKEELAMSTMNSVLNDSVSGRSSVASNTLPLEELPDPD